MIELNDISIRLAKRQDAVPVTELLRKVGLIQPDDKDIDAHWDRLWTNNPSYKDFPSEPHFGWIMEYQNRIVGYVGCFQRTYYFKGEPMPVCIASQWGVEKDFRRFSMLLCEKFFSENPIPFKLNTTALDVSGLIFERFGNGRRVPSEALKDVYMVPFHLPPIAMQRFKENYKKYSFLSPFIHFFTRVIPVNIKYKFIQQDKCLQEVDIHKLPTGFKIFWDNYLKNSHGFIASRNEEVIEWYYNRGFRKLDKKVFVYNQGGQIAGYASLVEEPIPGSSIKRYKIADILATDKKTKSVILKALLKLAYEMNADLVEVHIPGMISRDEIPAFIIKRKVPNWPCYYQTQDMVLDEKLQDPSNWNISSYDGDSCLF
jgi:hypothetical protein